MNRNPLFLALGLALFAAMAPNASHAQSSYAFIASTDFSSGCADWIDYGPPRAGNGCVESISDDPIARWWFGEVFVVNRFLNDNIQVLDPQNGFATDRQFSTGNGSNPQDIALVSPTKAYVSLLQESYLLIVNPSNGDSLGIISLAAYADADGEPEAHRMILYGDRLFVSLQRLDQTNFFSPTDFSLMAVIDTRTDQLIDVDPGTQGTQAILLTGKNPTTDLVFDPAANRILVGETGEFGLTDGGVERIDPVGFVAEGFESTEAQLGGDLNAIAIAPGGRGYVVVSDAGFNTLLVRYDRTSGALQNTLYNPGGFTLANIEVNDLGELWVCDRVMAAPGVRLYDTTNDAAIGGLIATGLPPFHIAFDDIPVVSVGDDVPARRSGLQLLQAGPNPTRGSFVVRFSVGEPGARPTRLTVFDARGAVISRQDAGALAEGSHQISWNTTQERAGVYFYQLERAGERLTGRFVVIP